MNTSPLRPLTAVRALHAGAPRFAFAAHPDAVEDLYDLPADVLDQAVEVLRGVIWGDFTGPMLQQHGELDLRGCRKLRLRGSDGGWRMVYTERPAPGRSPYTREVLLLAAGPRLDLQVYRSAATRLTTLKTTPWSADARSRAARATSPNLPTRHIAARPVPASSRGLPSSGSARHR